MAEDGDGAPGCARDRAGRLHQAAQCVGNAQGAGQLQGRLDEGDGGLAQTRLEDGGLPTSGGEELVGVDGVGQASRRGGLGGRCRRLIGLPGGLGELLEVVPGHTGKPGVLRESAYWVLRVVCGHRAQLVRLACCLS